MVYILLHSILASTWWREQGPIIWQRNFKHWQESDMTNQMYSIHEYHIWIYASCCSFSHNIYNGKPAEADTQTDRNTSLICGQVLKFMERCKVAVFRAKVSQAGATNTCGKERQKKTECWAYVWMCMELLCTHVPVEAPTLGLPLYFA